MNLICTVNAKECSYWNYDDHTRTHDCNSCNCQSEGNTIDNVKYGIMVNRDRYCMLDADVDAKILNGIKRRNGNKDQIGMLRFCDKCGTVHFLEYTGTDHLDGGFTRVDKFEKPPEGWKYSTELMMWLCPTCSTKWHKIIEQFKE